MKKIWGSIKSFIRNDNPAAKIKWSLYIRVWKEFGKPYWKWLALGIICTVASAGAEAFSITLVKQVIDKGFIEKNMSSLVWIGMEIVAVFCAKGALTYAKSLTMTKAGLLGVSKLRRRLYNNLIQQPLRYFYSTRRVSC